MNQKGGGVRRPAVALLGAPFDANSSYLRGAAEAPAAIRAALYSEATNLWSENGTDLGDGLLLSDAGDVAAGAGEDGFARIGEAVAGLLDRGLRPLVLGGDHAVSYPVIREVAARHEGLTVIDFDAHPDLYDEYQGNRLSHACPFARVMETGLVRRLVQAGIRTMNGQQRKQAARFGVEIIPMKEWRGAIPGVKPPLYISFDLDVLDPAFVPGISHWEPGGFSVREAVDAIQCLPAGVVGADIVECNPRRDPSGVTAAVAAKLLKEIAARMLETGARAAPRGRR